MDYKRVFSKTRFQTKSQNSFQLDHKSRSVFVGVRDISQHTAFIGKVIEQGRTSTILDYGVFCDVNFPHVIGVFGNRGSGKSFDLGVFLEEIFIPGKAGNLPNTTNAAIVFDIQDQFWTLGYEPGPDDSVDAQQVAELKKWGLEKSHVGDVSILVPVGYDTQVPNAVPFSLAAAQIAEADFLAILELERFSPMGQALITLLNKGKSNTPRQLALACTDNTGLLNNYQQSTVDGLRWRLESLAKTDIIADFGIQIDNLLQPQCLSIVLMRNLSDSMRALIVGVISRLVANRMGRSQQARKVARRTGNSIDANEENLANRLWMILDEAHILIPSDGATAATIPLIDYVKRGRDAGLSLIFATQQPSAVNSKLMSQVDMTVTHMLGFEADLTAAINRMPTRNTVDYEVNNERVSSISDVIRSLSPGEAIIADGASGRAFLAKIRPRRTAHGGDTPS